MEIIRVYMDVLIEQGEKLFIENSYTPVVENGPQKMLHLLEEGVKRWVMRKVLY